MTKDNLITLKFVKNVGARNASRLIGVNLLNRKHPKDVGLTYFSHLKFAWNETKEAWWMGVVMFVHGLLPWIWDWKFSQYLNDAKKRVDPQDEARNTK